MKETMKDIILNASADMTESCHKTDFIVSRGERCLPDRSCIIRILKDLKRVMFPGYFGEDTAARMFPGQFTAYLLNDFYDRMKKQVEIAFLYADQNMEKKEAEELRMFKLKQQKKREKHKGH